MPEKAETCECEGVRIEVKRAPQGVTINLDCCGSEGGKGKAVVVCCGGEEDAGEAKKD